jgi:hypothetical protein
VSGVSPSESTLRRAKARCVPLQGEGTARFTRSRDERQARHAVKPGDRISYARKQGSRHLRRRTTFHGKAPVTGRKPPGLLFFRRWSARAVRVYLLKSVSRGLRWAKVTS